MAYSEVQPTRAARHVVIFVLQLFEFPSGHLNATCVWEYCHIVQNKPLLFPFISLVFTSLKNNFRIIKYDMLGSTASTLDGLVRRQKREKPCAVNIKWFVITFPIIPVCFIFLLSRKMPQVSLSKAQLSAAMAARARIPRRKNASIKWINPSTSCVTRIPTCCFNFHGVFFVTPQPKHASTDEVRKIRIEDKLRAEPTVF